MKIFAALFTTIIHLSLFAQDNIIKTDGSIHPCLVKEITEDEIKYKKTNNPEGPLYSIKKSEVRKIKFQNGAEEIISEEEYYRNESSEVANDKEFDRNSQEFVDYANGLAKKVGDDLLRRCAGKVDGSQSAVYFDSVIKDPYSGEITIPIKISWEKGITNEKRWVQGSIIVNKDGSKKWVYQNASTSFLGSFSGCAKKFTF